MTNKQFSTYQNLDPYSNPSNIFFMRYCKYKVEVQKRNIIIVVIGSPGSGKSYSAIAFAEMLSACGVGTGFDINRIHFKALDFLEHIKKKNKDGSFVLKAGDCIILDEAGVVISSRDWFSEINKKILSVLETFRWRQLITILTVPDISFIDVKARKLLTMVFEMKHILKRQKIGIIKPLIVSVNQREGKIYYVYYRYRNPVDQSMYKITNLFLPIPTLELRNSYQKKKEEFATKLAEQMHRELEWSEIKKEFNHHQKKILSIIQTEGEIGYKKISVILGRKELAVYNDIKYINFILGKEYNEEPPK